MGLETVKMFHVLTDGKTVRELTQKQYSQLNGRHGYLVGWISKNEILFIRHQAIIVLNRKVIPELFALFDNSELNKKKGEA